MATLKKELKEILDKYGIDPQDKSKLWDCHGTLVLYHKAYEVIAAKENIKFDPPQIIESNSKDKTVCICVTGYMGDRKEWSFGEAAPGNCTNKYPYAMAEKRAKDRVIGKLVGLAQYVYSEDEADEFKSPKDNKAPEELTDIEDGKLRDFYCLLANCENPIDVDAICDEYEDLISVLPPKEMDALNDELKRARTRGKSVPHTYHFASAAKAREFYQTMIDRVPMAKDIKILADYMRRWDGKMKALDRQLGKKDEVNGMTPYNYLNYLYTEKTKPIAAE